MQLDDLVLEDLDLGSTGSLHIVDVGIHQRANSLAGKVGSEHSSLSGVGCAIGVGTDELRFNGRVLTVDDHLLPRGVRGVEDVVPLVDHNTVFVELLNLFDRGEAVGCIPLMLLEESRADVGEGGVESVTELQDSRVVLTELGVCESSVNFA